MRLKPTHLKAAVKVLTEGDFETAEEAAKAVIAEVDRLRAEDVTYSVVRQYNSPISGAMYMGYGPFPTLNAAQRAIEKEQVGIAGFGTVVVVPMRSHESQLARLASLDELPEHLAGHHWTRVREKVGA